MKPAVRSLLLLLALAVVPGATPSTFSFPATEPGRRVAAYFTAFNTGREEAVRAFIEANVSKAALARRPIQERLAVYRDMRDEHRQLTPVRVVASGDDHLEVVARTAKGVMLDMTFLFEAASPHSFTGLRVESGDAGDEGRATAPATPLSDAAAVRAWSATLDSLSRAGEFSGAVLFAKGDAVLFQSAYGYASRERQTPNRVDTKFNLGSLNKVFTKLAIAQLVDQGKVKLDDTIDHYLPDYPSAAATRVTVRQLLDHRGGIGDIFGEAYDRADKSKLRTVADWIPFFRDQPLAFTPGTQQQYSNGGYVLLGAIIEKASGESYYDYMRRHVYEPLGLKSTDHYAKDDRVANLATGYTRRLPGMESRSAGWTSNEPTRPLRGSPAGGGYSTLGDLLAFTRALRAGKVLNPERLRDGFSELAPGANGEMALGIGGGALGLNAAVEMSGPYTIIALANLDPPAAERAAATLRRWLPMPRGGQSIRVGGGAYGGGLGAPMSTGAGERVGVGGADAPDVVAVMSGPDHESPERTLIPEAGAHVEMSRSDHLPAVSVMVNGRGPYRFAIDTGGGGLASVDSALAAALHLETIGRVRAGDPSGRNAVLVDRVRLESLTIGEARFEGVVAAVRAGRLRRLGQPIDGILGFGLFQECLLTLDYPANRVRLERGELPAPNGQDVLALERRHGIPSVRLQVDSIWVDADVDAGAGGGFTLPAGMESRLALASVPRVVGHARTIGNEFDIRAAELKGSVRLGRYEFPGATVGFQPVFPMANVGARVLKDFRVTFDQRNGRMRLVRGT